MEEFDLKEFMDQEEIPSWSSEHHRVQALFAAMGATVLWVKSEWPFTWTVNVLRGPGLTNNLSTKTRVRRLLFPEGRIPITREQPHIFPQGQRLRFVYTNPEGELGILVKFNSMRRNGQLNPRFERIILPEWTRPPSAAEMQRLRRVLRL